MARSGTRFDLRVALVFAFAVALVGLAPAAALGAAGATPSAAGTGETAGWVLASRLAPDGSPLAGVLVFDGQGQQRRQIAVPVPLVAVATPRPHQALVQTEDGSIFLADAATGTARRVAIPATTAGTIPLRSPRFPAAMTARWALLGDSSLQATYLVDLETGAATDLTTLNPHLSPIISATIARDNSAVLADTGTDSWLISTATPSHARPLGGVGASFSDDGQHLVYTRRGAGTSVEVVVANADGSAPVVVARHDLAAVARFVPASHGSELVLITGQQVSEVAVATRRSRALVTLRGAPGMMTFAPSGRRLLVAEDQGTGGQAAAWHLADLASGRVQTLNALAGWTVYGGTAAQRWLLATDVGPGGVGKAGSSVAAVDLESGRVRPLLNLENGTLYQLPGDRSADGRFTVLTASPQTGQSRVYLLDAEQGGARMIAQAAAVDAVISPDGRLIALGTMVRTRQTRTWTLTVGSVAGAGRSVSGSAMPLAWLNP